MNPTSPAKPRRYKRSMSGWWLRLPWYRRYMLREATCFFVVAWAVEMLVGLLRLSQGREAWDGWRAAVASGPGVVWHLIVLAAFAYHAWTWFAVMPKTLPFIVVGGKRVSDRAIVGAGAAAAGAASLVLLAIFVWLAA